MKPILIFGASISAAAIAAGFAVLADQAMPRSAVEASPVPAANVARDAPDLARIIRHEIPQIAPATPAATAPLPVPPVASAPATAVTGDATPTQQMSLLPAASTGPVLYARPVSRPAVPREMGAARADAAASAPAHDPITMSRFDYIPLIGVYR